VQLIDVVAASGTVRSTRSRTAKIGALAEALRLAGPDEVETVTAYLSGVLRQRRTGLGWRGLTELPPPAGTPTLLVLEVHGTLEEISEVSGAGSKARRAELVDGLFGRATAAEQEYLRLLVTGQLRQGALDGLMLEAVASAAEVPAAAVRRASMFSGATLPVAVAALKEGEAGLARFALELGRPLRPMLASSAADVAEAFAKTAAGGAALAVDVKLDGIRGF
jgi:DNA ligase-1